MRRLFASLCISLLLAHLSGAHALAAYALNYTVADMRGPINESGGTACPQRIRMNLQAPAKIGRRWSTVLPASVLTQAVNATARVDEVEISIQNSFAVWSNVTGAALGSSSLSALTRTSAASACSFADGQNSLCFNQPDVAFQAGVLAFTRVVTSDRLGEMHGAHSASAFIGEILDADVYFRPPDGPSPLRFATPAALPTNPSAFDLESLLTHELGHLFGLGHTGVWRGMMFPFAPPTGQFVGERPTAQRRDAPLADDDRAGLRVLYPDPADTDFTGRIEGRVLPVNPLSLADQPATVTGIFGAHIVVADEESGAVLAATLAGWSCSGNGPPVFDGSYVVDRLPVNPARNFVVFAEPMDGPVAAVNVLFSLSAPALCRNASTDSGWPQQFACTVPAVNVDFATRLRPSTP